MLHNWIVFNYWLFPWCQTHTWKTTIISCSFFICPKGKGDRRSYEDNVSLRPQDTRGRFYKVQSRDRQNGVAAADVAERRCWAAPGRTKAQEAAEHPPLLCRRKDRWEEMTSHVWFEGRAEKQCWQAGPQKKTPNIFSQQSTGFLFCDRPRIGLTTGQQREQQLVVQDKHKYVRGFNRLVS